MKSGEISGRNLAAFVLCFLRAYSCGALRGRWLFCLETFFIPFTPIKIIIFPSTRLPLRGTSQAAGVVFLAGSLLLSLLCFLKILLFPSTRSGRAGPLLSGQQKVGKDWPKRAAPPLGFPTGGRARVPSAQPREGGAELLAPSELELPR